MSDNQTPAKPKFTIWQMLRDIFVTSINRGQFLTAILGILLVIVAYRLSVEALTEIVKDIYFSLKNGQILGYALFVLSLAAWYAHARRLRSIGTREQDRLGKEKSALQKQAGLGNKVRSSKKK